MTTKIVSSKKMTLTFSDGAVATRQGNSEYFEAFRNGTSVGLRARFETTKADGQIVTQRGWYPVSQLPLPGRRAIDDAQAANPAPRGILFDDVKRAVPEALNAQTPVT